MVIDPADGRLVGSQVLGEWNSTGLDGWTVNNAASFSVAGGLLTATSQNGTANPLQLDLTNMASGAYLDYGYNDYLQVRMQLPVGFNKDVVFYFGTTTHTGFASDRTFTLPASYIVGDGAMHTYRLDLGLVVWWRDTLRDLRIQPLGATGANENVSLDYVEVGDQPNDTLALNTNLNFTTGVTLATAQHDESKHFAVWWDPAVNPGGRTNFTTMAHNALRMLEESYQVYYKVLGFDEPFQTTSHSGARMKLNLITWYSGYWEGVWAGYAHINIDTTGLQDEGVGNPVPHEFGHATDSNQLGSLAGGHWESHANYYRDQRNLWFAPIFSSGQTSVSWNVMGWSNFRQDSQRLIYEDYRIWDPLTDWAESLGLPADEATRMWRLGSSGQTAWSKLQSQLPGGMNIKDVAAQLLEHWPLLDFNARSYMMAQLWGTTNSKAEWFWRLGSPLVPESDNPGWFRVPFERAPEKYAYMFHELTPDAGATSVTVNLRGLTLSSAVSTDADWRWSVIFTNANGDVLRYSSVFAPGTQTLAFNPGETKLLLFVVATPGSPSLDLTSQYNTAPTDESSGRVRYPYEVQVTGATPAPRPLGFVPSGAFHYYTNPDGSAGGLVENTATVASTAYIGPNAKVLGTSQVLNSAKVLDYAVVSGNSRVRNNAVVSGYAMLRNNAIVQDNALVTDHAIIENSAQVQGNAVVEQYARLGNSAIIRDSAIARGDSYLWDVANLSGNAIADYDYSMNYALSDGVHFNHIPFDSYFNVYYAQTQDKPRGLIASYRTEETSGSEWWDEFGALEAWLLGSPTRSADSFFNNSQVLSLNGSTQYAVLDRTLGNLASGTYGLWVNPSSSDANETLLYFGSSANTYLKLTARDAGGLAHLTISVNGTVQQLVSTASVPLNQWTHLAVTFGSGTATFYINGAAAGSAGMTFRPIDVLGPDTYSSSAAYYLGRDPAGNYFTGKLEDVRFYNVVLTQAEVKGEMSRSGARIGEFFQTAAMDFYGTSTTFESGVHNGATRTLQAWVYPRSNAASYQAIFDSYDERGSGNNRGNGFGLLSGIINVRLDGVGLWNTGVAVTLNAWQHIGVTISGGTANLYVNGVLRASRAYTTGVTPAKNYHVGFYQTDTNSPPTRTGYFNGQLYDARIYDSVVVPTGRFDQPPTAVNDTATVPGGTPSGINVLANDTDPNPIVTLKVSAVTQGTHGAVTIPTGGSAVIYTPVAGFTGADSFTYTASDGFGGTSVATVNLTVAVTLNSIVISPPNASLNNGDNQLFSATGYDQVGNPMNPVPTFTWSILSGAGTVTPSGGTNSSATFTAGNNSETVVIQAASGSVTATATVTVTSSLAPTFTALPSALPNPATTTTNLSVLADDPAGEANLTYFWSVTGSPPAPVSFLPASGPGSNGTNGAKNITASFTKAGNYNFQVQVINPSGYYAIASVIVQVAQTVTSIVVTPATPTVAANTTDQCTAVAMDQFGDPVAAQPNFTWSLAGGGGSVSASGLYSAPRTAGAATIRATAGAVHGDAAVTIFYEELAWYQADTSGTTLIDASGHGKTASMTGTLNTNYNFTAGVEGTALHLITSGSPAVEYATLPTGIVAGLTDFTVAAWVKIDTLSTWSRIFDFGTGTTVNMFLTPRATGTGGPLRFAITTAGSGGEQQVNGPVLSAGLWYHIAVTLVGATATMYVNGVAVASNTGMTLNPSSLGSTTLNYLGKSQYGDPGFQGSIDDFRIFGRGLSAAEVLRLATPAVVAGPAPAVTPVTLPSATLNVLASDVTAGESALTYTWTTTGSPPAPVNFSVNGTNAAKNTVATFTKPGTYNFQITIINPALSAVPALATVATTSITVYGAVAGRSIFYNNSSFDGNDPTANIADDNAIATDKSALLPGQAATFANYNSYSKGINGLMIDISGAAASLSAGDFTFMVGSDGTNWSAAPATASFQTRAGPGGSTRVEFTWNDNALQDQWLQVTVLANTDTNLAGNDVFYFGNAIGDTGNSATDAKVTIADVLGTRANFVGSAIQTNVYDFNRDGVVDPTDVGIAAANQTGFSDALALISPPAPPPAAPPAFSAPLVTFAQPAVSSSQLAIAAPSARPPGAAPLFDFDASRRAAAPWVSAVHLPTVTLPAGVVLPLIHPARAPRVRSQARLHGLQNLELLHDLELPR